MRKWLSVATLAVASFALAGTAGAASTKDNFDLKGEVYAKGMKIEMKNANNRPLTTVRARTYRIKIEDEATIHNFHLRGPGVNKITSIPRRSEQIWTVQLRKGKYTFVCDPHARFMHGTFRVT
jgi:heme/copper-type cytochrome/quinol oxidase subunit 2